MNPASRIGLAAMFAMVVSCLAVADKNKGSANQDAGPPSPLSILQAQVPRIGAAGCEIPGAESDVYLEQGLLDVALDKDYPYWLYPLVQNQLPAPDSGVIEENQIQLTGFDIEMESPAGVVVPWACSMPFTFPATRALNAGQAAASAIQLLMPCHAGTLRQMFIDGTLPVKSTTPIIFLAHVRAAGTVAGGRIESDSFVFPIRVCFGCLQTGFSEPGFTTFDFPNAPACNDLATNPFPGNPCNIAQDVGPVLCCTSGPTEILTCPGRPEI